MWRSKTTKSAPAFAAALAFALAFLSVIPEGNLLLPLPLLFCLSFPKGICCCCCPCFSVCHSRRESAVAVAPAFLSVIPEGNLLLPLPLLFCLSFPKGICCRCCPCFSVCHSRRESAVSLAPAFAFPSVTREANPLFSYPASLRKPLSRLRQPKPRNRHHRPQPPHQPKPRKAHHRARAQIFSPVIPRLR